MSDSRVLDTKLRHRLYMRDYRARHREGINARQRALWKVRPARAVLILHKRCRFCQETLPVDSFYRHKWSADGLYSYCRACQNRFSELARQRRRQAGRPLSRQSPEHIALLRRLWRLAHPLQVQLRRARDRAKRRAALQRNGVETVDFMAILVRDGWRCHICKQRVTRKTLSFDHLIPVVHGGPHAMTNIAVAHRQCNLRRGPGRIPAQLLLLTEPISNKKEFAYGGMKA